MYSVSRDQDGCGASFNRCGAKIVDYAFISDYASARFQMRLYPPSLSPAWLLDHALTLKLIFADPQQ
jgi:hypothetical protein